MWSVQGQWQHGRFCDAVCEDTRIFAKMSKKLKGANCPLKRLCESLGVSVKASAIPLTPAAAELKRKKTLFKIACCKVANLQGGKMPGLLIATMSK